MADYEIECNECGWRGLESALDSQADETGDDNTLKFCPDCGFMLEKAVAEEREHRRRRILL